MELAKITLDLRYAIDELLESAKMKEGSILVVGCSTSEIAGEKIGTASNLDIAGAVFEGIYPVCAQQGLYMAVQCCEHLNRALVVERECMDKFRLDEVWVRPYQKAGGSLAHLAMERFQDPVVVESIQAHGGLDIGDAFIGMHLKSVAVPVRSSVKEIGHAHLTMARTRPKLIGGERARYI